MSRALSTAARADSSADGCSVFAPAPLYLNGKMHYSATTKCTRWKYARTSYIGNEWFKPGADTSSWDSNATHVCNPGGSVKQCAVSTTGPHKGAGPYCTVAMTDIWFDTRISYGRARRTAEPLTTRGRPPGRPHRLTRR